MNQSKLKLTVFIFCIAVAVLAFPPRVNADAWNKKTTVTFNVPVEIPGVGAQVLPAGTYVFKILDAQANRNIVQISNERGDHIFATILAVPNYRLKPADKTVITFRERAAGEPEALRAWFYPGNSWGQEFVYPKERAIALAKATDFPVLAMPTELATNLTMPVMEVTEPAVVALKQAPIEAVQPTGEVVPLAEVVEAPPMQVASVQTPTYDERLPQTASLLPIMGLVGLMALIAGFALWILPIRRVS